MGFFDKRSIVSKVYIYLVGRRKRTGIWEVIALNNFKREDIKAKMSNYMEIYNCASKFEAENIADEWNETGKAVTA